MKIAALRKSASILPGIMLLLAGLFLSGCSAAAAKTPQVLPTVVLDSAAAATPVSPTAAVETGSGGVSASGALVPLQTARMSFSTGANILAVMVKDGETVKAGQVLVQLAGREELDAAVKSANYEVLSAEKALQDLKDDAEQARAAAQLRLAEALDRVDQAEKRRGWKEYQVGSRSQIDAARANLIIAEDGLRQAEEVFGLVADSPEDNLNRAQALIALAAARTARDKALADLNYLLSLPDAIEVGKADAELEVAHAGLDAAQREYDLLKDGPDPEALALAAARLENARAQLLAGRSALAGLELTAPFDGTVGSLSATAGEWVSPGQVVLVLADLSRLRVETTDLSERDVMRVEPGQQASIFVKAAGLEVGGRVAEVSPLANTLGGDVVYKTVIDLDDPPEGLWAGMSVDVQFLTH